MPVTYSWFCNTNPSNPNSPASYNKISGFPQHCMGVSQVCAIYAQVDNNNKPMIPIALSDEITTALNNMLDSNNVKLKD